MLSFNTTKNFWRFLLPTRFCFLENVLIFCTKTFTFSVLALRKIMLKKLKFVERIFHFLRDILVFLNSLRFSSCSNTVNYYLFVCFLMGIQIHNPFDMQGFYYKKDKRNLYVSWCYVFLELFWNFIYHPSVVHFRNVCFCSFVDA